MRAYNLAYLKEKGFFETERKAKDEYTQGEEIEYKFDPENRLAYFEDFDREEISDVVKGLKEKKTFDYYWFWEEGRVCCFRTYGEHKKFIYNLKHKRKCEWRKGKKKKLRNFSSQNPNVLFEAKDVIDLFYRRLWSLRVTLADSIEDDIGESEKIMCAQRIIDRLIFVYFLTEKGIIRVLDKNGNTVPIDTKKFFAYLLKESDCFYDTLNRIFFDFLNNRRKDNMSIRGTEEFLLRVPYLNGGLFREKSLPAPEGEIDESELAIESFDWKELIDELNKYNWIIEEFEAVEKGLDEEEMKKIEGNLTPEILGHIYEKFVIEISELDEIEIEKLKETHKKKLKKGRKKVGGYYTPQDVTRYISQNVLWPLLSERVGVEEEFDSFEEFFKTYKNSEETLEKANNILKNVKILDPAVGSGHFLLTIAEIIRNWRRKCGEKIPEHDLRMEIVTDNLYGIDIMGGAVEICKLRLWLWIIAGSESAEHVEPLPNIEFNYRQGNSLVGFIEPPWEDTESVGNYVLRTKKEKQHKLKGPKRKQTVFDQGDPISEVMKKRKELIDEYKTSSKSPEEIKRKIEEKSKPLRKKIDEKFAKRIQDFTDLKREDVESLNPFHWGFEFYDVFNSEAPDESGFDIVVGNPPYGIDVLGKEEEEILAEYRASGCGDIAGFFFERELDLLAEGGRLGNVIAGSLATNRRMTPVRDLMREKGSFSLAFFGIRPAKLFPDNDERVCIVIGEKDDPKPIKTAGNIRFVKEERPNIFNNLNYTNTDGLLLGRKIGIRQNKEETRLPKLGSKTARNILEKLKKVGISHRKLEDVEGQGDYNLEYRKSARYWIHALYEFPYESTMIEKLCFPSEEERNYILLCLNSSLFYLYWCVYGNNRHIQKTILNPFPVPRKKIIEEKSDKIRKLSDEIVERHLETFQPQKGVVGEFNSGKCKDYIDRIDDFLARIYRLDEKEASFVKGYDSHLRSE